MNTFEPLIADKLAEPPEGFSQFADAVESLKGMAGNIEMLCRIDTPEQRLQNSEPGTHSKVWYLLPRNLAGW